MARKKDRIKTKQLVMAEEAKCQAQLTEQQLRFDKELEKHLDFAQNIVTDKVQVPVTYPAYEQSNALTHRLSA